MNINTEKQNLFSLSVQPQAYSPYLSPLLANNNSKCFQQDQQLLNFHLNQDNQDNASYEQHDNLLHNQNTNNNNANINICMSMSMNMNMNERDDNKDAIEQELMRQDSLQCIIEKKPVYSIMRKSSTKIYTIINYLVDHDGLPELQIKQAGKQLYEDSPILQHIFNVMLTKLKKLHKTKQQMTKFCMRKAFKYVADGQAQNRRKCKNNNNSKSDKNKSNSNSNININTNTSDKLNDKNPQKLKDDNTDNYSINIGFQMPFRKNSTQKTMNAQFLKQVFSRQQFVASYKKFLQDFHNIINRDNQYKIKYLADTIENYTKSQNDYKKIQEIKRLPWTRTILNKTQQLAHKLLKFTSEEGCEPQIFQKQNKKQKIKDKQKQKEKEKQKEKQKQKNKDKQKQRTEVSDRPKTKKPK